MIEQWKVIEGSDGYYEISNLGVMRRNEYYFVDKIGKHQHRVHKEYTPIFNKKNGYYSYRYRCADGTSIGQYAHRLVAIHFIVKMKEEYRAVNHIDGIKSNNNYENLEWCTDKMNMEHASKNGLINRDSEVRKRQAPINAQKGLYKLFKSVVEYDEKGDLLVIHDSYNKIRTSTDKKSTVSCHRLSYKDHFFRSYELFMEKYGSIPKHIEVSHINNVRTHRRKWYTARDVDGNIFGSYSQLDKLPITREELWFCYNHDICDSDGHFWEIQDR